MPLLFSNAPFYLWGEVLRPAAELAAPAGEGKEEKPAKEGGGARAGGGDGGGGEGGCDGRWRLQGKERGEGASGKGARREGAQAREVASRSCYGRSASRLLLQVAQNLGDFQVWQMCSPPPPAPAFTKATTDFDCSAAEGSADSSASRSGLAVDRSPAGAPQLVHLVCVRDNRGSPGGDERVPSPAPPPLAPLGDSSGRGVVQNRGARCAWLRHQPKSP